MTRDQIEMLTSTLAPAPDLPAPDLPAPQLPAPQLPAPQLPAPQLPAPSPNDATTVAPRVADGVAVRFVDAAAPWLADIGADPRGTALAPAVVARVSIRYDDTKADLVHDEEFEAVLFPLGDPVDASALVQVDYDDRDLRVDAPTGGIFHLTDAPIDTKAYFAEAERGIRDHLTRTLTLEIPTNPELKLYGRPGESPADFAARCARTADDRADVEIAALRDKYETRATKLRDQIDAAEDRADVLSEEAQGKKTSEFFSTAGSVLGGLLGGRKSAGGMLGDIMGDAGTAARRRGSTSAADERVDAAENKVRRLVTQYEELEAEVEHDVVEIGERWRSIGAKVTTTAIRLERTDVTVAQLVLAWVPVE